MIIMNTTKNSTSKMGNFPQYTLKQDVWGEKDFNYLNYLVKRIHPNYCIN